MKRRLQNFVEIAFVLLLLASVFTSQHEAFAADQQFDGIFNRDAFLKFWTDRWDTTVYVFNHDAPGQSAQWGYASRVRCRVDDRQKLGVEILGTWRDVSAPNVSLGYYGDLTPTLSINIVAGTNLKSGRQRLARTELVWQFN